MVQAHFLSFIQKLKSMVPDAVCLDYETGVPFEYMVSLVRKVLPSTPIIVVSGSQNAPMVATQCGVEGIIKKQEILTDEGFSKLEEIVESMGGF